MHFFCYNFVWARIARDKNGSKRYSHSRQSKLFAKDAGADVPYLQSCYANIAADLGPREIPDRNKFGGEQKRYNYSNECNIRCNFDAKNTLAFNYLTMISGGGT